MADGTMSKNKSVVARWVEEVFNQKNLAAIDELKVHSYLDWTPFPTQKLDLPVSGLKESLPEFFRAIPDFHFVAEEFLGEGDMVVCVGSWSGTHLGEFMGIPPTGRRVSGTRTDIFRLVGDKMCEHWGCGGELGVLRLLTGMEPPEYGAENSADPGNIAREFVEQTLNGRSLTAIDVLVDDHAVDHTNQSLGMFLLLTAFPDLRVDIRETITQGNKVTVLSSFSGTHQGEFMGIPATGRGISCMMSHVLTIADRKIVEAWSHWDSTEVVMQISA